MEDAIQTSVIKVCGACGLDLLGRDKFCRHCGIKQPAADGITTRVVALSGVATSNLVFPPPAARTSPLSEADNYHKVSGPLMGAVAMRIASHASGKPHGRFARRALSALISVTVWLMIVLLSPLDAYFAAKDVSSQVALK
jgi:hypothetical protein